VHNSNEAGYSGTGDQLKVRLNGMLTIKIPKIDIIDSCSKLLTFHDFLVTDSRIPLSDQTHHAS
jgi:hypothetical protein